MIPDKGWPAGYQARPQRALLNRIRTHAEASPEIVGLLLFGSLAAGTEDEHSDLDIGLYVHDAAFATFDLRRWLKPIADVAAVYVDQYCSTVIFADDGEHEVLGLVNRLPRPKLPLTSWASTRSSSTTRG